MVLANYDAAIRKQTNGHFELTIHQGVQIGRPSRLEVSIFKKDNHLSKIEVGGSAVLVSSGKCITD